MNFQPPNPPSPPKKKKAENAKPEIIKYEKGAIKKDQVKQKQNWRNGDLNPGPSAGNVKHRGA